MSQELRLNRMPAITWNWLRLNDRQIQFPTESAVLDPVLDTEADVTVSADAAAVAELHGGAGNAFDELAAAAPFTVYQSKAGDKESGAVRLKFDYEDGMHSMSRVGLVAEENSVLTVVMDYRSDTAAAGTAGIQTKALVKDHALLRLIQIHRLGEGFTCVNDIAAQCGEKARMELIHVVFSGKETDIGARVELKGNDSTYDADIGYLCAKDHVIDMNYYIPQLGQRTHSNINATGVLRDTAKKTFRGTIDFIRGAAASTGDETENVLLMDDGVVNQSVPVILCSEEDVEGNHGATIGKLSEELLFYLESRGIPFEDIYEMMAKARLESVFRRIPDEKTVDELAEFNEEGSAE